MEARFVLSWVSVSLSVMAGLARSREQKALLGLKEGGNSPGAEIASPLNLIAQSLEMGTRLSRLRVVSATKGGTA
jgi:hypothetical protein